MTMITGLLACAPLTGAVPHRHCWSANSILYPMRGPYSICTNVFVRLDRLLVVKYAQLRDTCVRVQRCDGAASLLVDLWRQDDHYDGPAIGMNNSAELCRIKSRHPYPVDPSTGVLIEALMVAIRAICATTRSVDLDRHELQNNSTWRKCCT